MKSVQDVLNGFNAETPSSYTEYLELAGIDSSATAFVAYDHFLNIRKEKGKLTARDILEYLKNITRENFVLENYIRENLDQDPAIVAYCNEQPRDPICVCVNTALINVLQWKKVEADYKTEKNIIDLKNQIGDYIFKYSEQKFNDITVPNEEKEYRDWSETPDGDGWKDKVSGGPSQKDYPESDYAHIVVDETFLRNKWLVKYKQKYIDDTLLPKFKTNNYPKRTYVKDDYPPKGEVKNITQCCTNAVIAYENANLNNISQGCDQKIINASMQEELEKAAAEEEARIQQEEQAILDSEAEAEAAKKKKMFKYIAIVIGILVCLGIIGFVYYNFFRSNSDSVKLSESTESSPDLSSPS